MVKKPLIDGGIFTADDLGMIGSALFYSYAAGKLINGFVSDHANARQFFAIGLLLSALCNIAMGFSTTVMAATLGLGSQRLVPELWRAGLRGVAGGLVLQPASAGAITASGRPRIRSARG